MHLFAKISSKFTQIKFLLGKTALLSSLIILTACSSTPSTQQLSKGIQKSFSVSHPIANKISPLILQNSEKHNVPATLIAAVIHQESSYRAHAQSSSGAIGLMQIIPRYWQKSCPGDLYNEEVNINCGSYILSQYHNKAGSWDKALGYYNVGPAGYENNRSSRKSGKKYANSVQNHEKQLKKVL